MPQSINDKNVGDSPAVTVATTFATDVIKIKLRLLKKQTAKTYMNKRKA